MSSTRLRPRYPSPTPVGENTPSNPVITTTIPSQPLSPLSASLTPAARKSTAHMSQIQLCLQYARSTQQTDAAREYELSLSQRLYLMDFRPSEQEEEDLKNELIKLRQGFYHAHYGDWMASYLSAHQNTIPEIAFDADFASKLWETRDWPALSAQLTKDEAQWKENCFMNLHPRMPHQLFQMRQCCDRIGIDPDFTITCIHTFAAADGQFANDTEDLILRERDDVLRTRLGADLGDLVSLFGYPGIDLGPLYVHFLKFCENWFDLQGSNPDEWRVRWSGYLHRKLDAEADALRDDRATALETWRHDAETWKAQAEYSMHLTRMEEAMDAHGEVEDGVDHEKLGKSLMHLYGNKHGDWSRSTGDRMDMLDERDAIVCTQFLLKWMHDEMHPQ